MYQNINKLHRKHDQLPRHWLKLRKIAHDKIPKKILPMLENDLDMHAYSSTRKWAEDIKRCLKSYGFQDVSTNNETIFFLHSK